MPVPQNFLSSLVYYIRTMNLQDELKTEFGQLFEAMGKGEGATIVNSSMNGKSVGLMIQMTVEEKFALWGEALQILNCDRVVLTHGRFCDLDR